MARIKATVRRLNRSTFVAAPGQRIGNKNIMKTFNVQNATNWSGRSKKKKWPGCKKNECQKKITLFFWKQKAMILNFYFKCCTNFIKGRLRFYVSFQYHF